MRIYPEVARFFSCHDLKIYFPTEKENKEELKQGCFEKLSKSSLLEAAAIKKNHFHQEQAHLSPKKLLRGKLEKNWRKTGEKLEENWRETGGKLEEN